MVRTDVTCRALPWARLILETANAPADLNLRGAQRLSAALVALALAAASWRPCWPALVALTAAALVGGRGDQPPLLRAPLAPRRRTASPLAGVRPPPPLLRSTARRASPMSGRRCPPPAPRRDERSRARARVVVIGAGPAGLTAARELARQGLRPSCSRRAASSAGSPARRATRASTSTWAATASSPRWTRSRRSGRTCSAPTSCAGPACRASTTTAGSSTIRSSRSTRWRGSASGGPCSSC